MSLEKRVEQLESHFDSLDSAVRSLIKITADTHREILATRQEMREYQQENRLRFAQLEQENRLRFAQLEQENRLRFAQLESELSEAKAVTAALTEATHAGFKRTDEKIDQLELLIRQLLPNANN